MDPLTQGALGAALPLATRGRRFAALAGAVGFAGGMAADLDVLIRSAADPLLFLEYHRQFTHSLAFVPVGGLICAAALWALFRGRLPVGFAHVWLFCALGYGTHGLLDAATSYGTMLFWPFSDARVAFSLVSVVDPLFTLPVLALVVTGMVRGSGRWGRLALAWAAVYLALGALQHNRALAAGAALAADRGHAPARLEVKPSFGNLLVWRLVYETADRYHVDALRAGREVRVIPGGTLAKLDVARDFPGLDPASRQGRDIGRFAVFSDGYLARDPSRPGHVMDVRYSFLPNGTAPLWSIRLDPGAGPDAHVTFHTHRRDAAARLGALWRMIVGAGGQPFR